ncbi:MAG: sulfatase-like hydrolase/transferase [Magnetococcales bacterium]|nr:sulfatase-like hydrolase/transferase [Magnetococcales bacterium]
MAFNKIEESAWSRSPKQFFLHFLVDIKLWFFCLGLLLIGRLFYLVELSEHLAPDTGLYEMLVSMVYGLRFDAKVVTRWLIPLLLLDFIVVLLPIRRFLKFVRIIWGGVFIFLTVTLSQVSVDYYLEYGDIFNEELFGLIYDDADVIFVTMVKSYNLIPKMIAITAVSLALIWLYNKALEIQVFQFSDKLHSLWSVWWRQLLTFLLVLVLLVIALRGSWGSRPVQMKDAGIFTDQFLNLTVTNPFIDLSAAMKVHKELGSNVALKSFQADGDIRAAVRNYFKTDSNLATLDDYFITKAAGPKGVVPRHIVLLVMESYDSWPMREKYNSLGLAEGVKKLGDEGLLWQSFLPASVGTMRSLATIITGIPDVYLRTNYQTTAKTTYATASAAIFKRLGYRTNLFYGGFLTWENIAGFAKDQGFENVYGASHMTKWNKTDWSNTNEWGVDDKNLFAFVEDTLKDDKPSFSIVLSTTNHPPYDLDVYKEGFGLKKIPAALAGELKKSKTEEGILNEMGHFWYADMVVSNFIRSTEKHLPKPLFVITGDHFGRKHMSVKRPLYDSVSVPLVLYGKDVLSGIKQPPNEGGSQMDIVPTLLELSAPKGFIYHRMGRDLLTPSDTPIGNAYKRIIGANFVYDINSQKIEPIPGRPLIAPYNKDELKNIYNSQSAVAWWRIRKGATLPPINNK